MADTTLYPSKDSYISEMAAGGNFGSANVLYVYSSYWDENDDNCRTLIEFDISGLPANAHIISALLKLTCYDAAAGRTYEFRRITGAWTEGEVTWNNQPVVTNTNGVNHASPSSIGLYSKSVTAIVQDAVDLGVAFGVRIKDSNESDESSEDLTRFRSKEYNSSDPELYIEYSLPTVHEVTIIDSLGMLDSTTKILGLKKTVTDSIGMLESVAKQFDAKKTVTDILGLLDTAPTKGTFFQTVSDKIGMTDTITRQKSMFQTISDILGLSDFTTNKGAFKQAVTDVLGMLDSATRGFLVSVTISEILGLRDRLVTKKKAPLRDLPDHTERGGATDA